MTQLSLKRLLRKKDIQFVLKQLTEAIAHPVCVRDTDGQVWLGTETDNLPNQYRIELEGECLGWVMGHADAAAIAHLLSMLAQRELDQKHLARETLDRYKEITLLYDISEKITAQLDLQSVAQLVLEEAQKLIPGDRGAVILHQIDSSANARPLGNRSDKISDRMSDRTSDEYSELSNPPTGLDTALVGVLPATPCQGNAESRAGIVCSPATTVAPLASDAAEMFEAIAHFGIETPSTQATCIDAGASATTSTVTSTMTMAIAPGEGILGTVFSSGSGEIVNHVQGDRRCQQAEQGYQALVCAPLKTQERVLGVIVLGVSVLGLGNSHGNDQNVDQTDSKNDDFPRPRSDRGTLPNYSAGDLKLLNALASQAAAAIENALLHEKELREARIKSNLERYVPAQLVQAILEAKDDISLAPNRKNITILFSDIRNFTSHCERLEPELIVGYLNEYFSHMVDIIFTHKGTVNKFVGDMIVALFGAPSPMVASEQQAIETAIAMQQRIQAFPLAWIRENFHTGIGISAGRVIVGNIGSPQHTDYTAIGDEVNTASRLQAIAQGGQILVSRNVYESTRHVFTFKSIGTLNLKGKRRAIEVFEVQY